MGRRIFGAVLCVCGCTAAAAIYLVHGAHKRYVRGMWYE